VLSYQTTGAKQLESITTPENNTLTYAYNGGLLTSETLSGEVEGSVSFGYDNHFRANSITVNGSTIEYSYDDDGSLTTAGDLTFIKNTDNGVLESTTLGDMSTNFTYSSFGEMDSFIAKYTDTEYFKTLYTRDKLGRITQKTETIEGATNTYVYEYDVAGRLDKVYKDTVKISDYKYDENGNRLTSNDSPLALLSDYDDQDRLLYEPVSDTTYAYNAHGDLETKTDSEGKTSYNYDELGNLISVTLPSSAVIDYTIDGRNRRVAKKVDGVVAYRFIYQDQLNPIAKVDADGNLIERYVYGSKGNIPDYIIRDGEKYSIVSDHLGSPRLVVKVSDGSVVQKINYNEFGVMTNKFTALGFDKIPFGFAGGIYDVHTKLVRFGARDYSAKTGRWTAKDPIGFTSGDGENFYAYVMNDPINYLDPLGLWRWGDPLPSWLVDGAAGFGDVLSFGLTKLIRQAIGIDGVVNPCSDAYSDGEWLGVGLSLAMGVAGGLKAAGAKGVGKEFSHWIPNRMGGPRSLFNGNYVSKAYHALSDPYRYRFMPRAWKAMNPIKNAFARQAMRIPKVYTGTAAGAAYGAGSKALNDGRK